MITIEIVSDTVCPWCYIGKRRLERALAEKPPKDEVGISWRPFQLNPDMPPDGMDREAYLEAKFGGPAGAKQVYDTIRRAGQSEGLDFAFERVPRTPNTINSHRLARRAAAAGCQDAVIESLFRAYFLEGRDVSEVTTLVEIAEAAGMDGEEIRVYLESDEDAEEVRAEDQLARQMHIQGVPFFIINQKYAISGAQDPAVFHKAFAMIAEEAEKVEGEAQADEPA